jgi:DNA-binding XRE family transcriptional regulator
MTTNILDNIDLRTLGELLQQARKKCNITQTDAAKIIDAARTTMIAIEKGERRIKANELIKLARAYGRSVSDFVRQLPVVQPFEELGLEQIPQMIDIMPFHYQHLAIEALDQGLITEGRFADFLCVNRLESRRIAEVLREYSSGMIEEDTDFDLR